MTFTEIADQRRLSSVKPHLGALTWEVDPDGYQRLKVPPTADVEPLLKLLARRGLDPTLTSLLLDRFATRPIERALIAYDIAAGSLLGDVDGALVQHLPEALAPLAPLEPTAAAAVTRDRVDALIEVVTKAGERPMPEGGAQVPSLASAIALTEEGVAAVLAFSARLERAHLPSLAIAFLQILWSRLALPAAMDRMLEIAIDYERYESLPELTGQRQAYLIARAFLAQLDTARAEPYLPATVTDTALTVARAELALLSDEPVDPALDAIASSTPEWRYAARIASAMRIKKHPPDAAIWVESWVTTFGNDMRVWAAAGMCFEQKAELLALVSREIRFCSFDPEAWRALAVFSDDAPALEIELQARAAAQLTAWLPFVWPRFVLNQPIDVRRSWTASFDSYDERNEVCYYRVRTFTGTSVAGELMAKLDMTFAGENWKTPLFAAELRRQIAEIAAHGKTNTTYNGIG